MKRTRQTPAASRLSTLRVRVPDSVLLRRVESELLVFDSESNRYFVLDEMGERIWAKLAEAGDLLPVYEELLASYDVEPRLLERDLERFVDRLAKLGLIEVLDGGP